GLGDTSPQLDATAQQLAHHDGPAMSLELEHILAGVRMRRREENGKALVDRLSVRCHEARKARIANLRQSAEQGEPDATDSRTRDANDADAAATGRRGNGRDGVGRDA